MAVGAGGKVSVFNNAGSTEFNLDIHGYFSVSGSGSGGFHPVDAVRIVDSTTGLGVTAPEMAANGITDISVTGGVVPIGATAIFANVKVSSAESNGTIRVGTGGANLNSAPSALTYEAGAYADSGVAIPLSADGEMRLMNNGASDVTLYVDIQGYFMSGDDGGGFTAVSFANIADGLTVPAGDTVDVPAAGIAGLPNAASLGSVAIGVYVSGWSSDGGLVLHDPEAYPAPNLSNVSFGADIDSVVGINGSAIVPTSRTGKIAIRNKSNSSIQVRLTAEAWFEPDNSQVQARAILDAAERDYKGTATNQDIELLKSVGLEDKVPDGSLAPQVATEDELDTQAASYVELDNSDLGVDSTVPGDNTCSSGTDPNCVDGVTRNADLADDGTVTDSTPQDTAPRIYARSSSSTVYIPGCPTGERARRYTVTMTHKSFLFRTTIFAWSHRIHYCTKNGKVTRWRARYDWLSEAESEVRFRGLELDNATGGLPRSGASSLRQREIELCVYVGCYASGHPWSKLSVDGYGGKSYKGEDE